jgi:hypothetical protein
MKAGCSFTTHKGGFMSSDKHHRRPRSLGGKSNKRNRVRVDENRHHFWHCLFQNMPGDQIARELNTMWLDSDYITVHKSTLTPRRLRELIEQAKA